MNATHHQRRIPIYQLTLCSCMGTESNSSTARNGLPRNQGNCYKRDSRYFSLLFCRSDLALAPSPAPVKNCDFLPECKRCALFCLRFYEGPVGYSSIQGNGFASLQNPIRK